MADFELALLRLISIPRRRRRILVYISFAALGLAVVPSRLSKLDSGFPPASTNPCKISCGFLTRRMSLMKSSIVIPSMFNPDSLNDAYISEYSSAMYFSTATNLLSSGFGSTSISSLVPSDKNLTFLREFQRTSSTVSDGISLSSTIPLLKS